MSATQVRELITQLDQLGRTVQTQLTSDPQGPVKIDTTYDGNGLVHTVSAPYRATSESTYGLSQYTYDARGRTLFEVHADGSQIAHSFSGNTSTTIDEAGRAWTRTSDALGRLVQVAELGTSSSPLSLSTGYTYDPLGNLTTVNQAGGPGDTPRTRSFVYDSLSRLTSSTNPETGTIGYTYDANSNLLSKTDARNIATTYTYDALNRITGANAPGMNEGFAYDLSALGAFAVSNPIGRLVQHAKPYEGNSLQFSYDAMGRVVTQGNTLPNGCCVPTANEIHAVYDLGGNMTDLTYPDGRHIQQSFDAAGRLTASNLVDIGGVSTSASYLQGVTYLADGSPGVLTLGNAVQQTIAKNNRLQVQNLVVADPLTDATYISRTYCYVGCTTGGAANNGNIWGITDNQNVNRTQGFTYDALNRIGSFSLGGAVNQQYSIDSFGNMSQTLGGGFIPSFIPPVGQPVTNRITNLPCASYSPSGTGYDAAGNQLCSTDPATQLVSLYSYDAESRISSIALQANSASPFVSYVYGADGARVRKNNADGTFTEYVDFNGQPIAEKDQNGQWTDYIYAEGKKIARVTQQYQRLHLNGSGCGPNAEVDWNVATNSVPIGVGDRMVWMEEHADGQQSYLKVQFSNNTWIFEGAMDPQSGVWQTASVDLSSWAGDDLYGMWIAEISDGNGLVDAKLTDLALVKADGTVIPYFNGQAGVPGSSTLSCTNGTAVSENVPVDAGAGALVGTKYYLGDHLGTAQMEFSSGGWPVWQGQFAPYGQELDSQTTQNHYKFTGKERDAESGLDYFGARYYASSVGRWMSPDWADKPEAVPYSSLDDPQSLNLYGYVGNNPLSKADADGHCWKHFGWACSAGQAVNNAADSFYHAVNRVIGLDEPTASANVSNSPSSSASPSLGTMAALGLAASQQGNQAAIDQAIDQAMNPEEGVSAYEVGTYGDLVQRSVIGDELAIDHIPSNASNIVSREAQLGRRLTEAEKAAIRDQGTAVAVPSDLHQSASPTFGGRNTAAQIQADAANPQAAAVRDTQAMVNAASSANKQAAQAAAQKVCTAAGCQ